MEPARVNVPFTRKKLRDGTVLPLSEQERIALERAIKLAERTKARENLTWMRHWDGTQWTKEEYEMIVAMLGLEDINV